VKNISLNQIEAAAFADFSRIHIVLFGLRLNLASQLGRSTLSHSYGYASAVDRPTVLASFTLIPESLVQYAS